MGEQRSSLLIGTDSETMRLVWGFCLPNGNYEWWNNDIHIIV